MRPYRQFIERRLVRPLLFMGWRITRGMTLGVRVMAFDEAGRVLLVRHSYTPGWYFPGGGVDSGETAADAARRELIEETGLEALGELKLIGFFHNVRTSRSDHVALYEAADWSRKTDPPLGGEIVEIGFFAPDALPDDTTASTRARLKERGGERPSEIW
jgi:8-oxo-dGTP pyrophosphatase MutT (NUDIX family)